MDAEGQLDEREEKFNKLKKRFDTVKDLSYEADNLARVLKDVLGIYTEQKRIYEIHYLSEILCKKFDEIIAVF